MLRLLAQIAPSNACPTCMSSMSRAFTRGASRGGAKLTNLTHLTKRTNPVHFSRLFSRFYPAGALQIQSLQIQSLQMQSLQMQNLEDTP